MKRLEQCGYINREINNTKENSKRRKVFVNYDNLYNLDLKSKKNDNSLGL